MTCQLCGKPLPKFRLRRDGDFCCREHREQYRLRRGLNCVQEAEELAALRRRRERPVAIALQRAACPPASMALRRAASGPYPGAAHAPEDRLLPPLEIRSATRLPSAGRVMSASGPRRGAAAYGRRGASAAPAIAPRLVLMPEDAAPRAALLNARVPAGNDFRAPARPRAQAAGARRASGCDVPRRPAPALPAPEIAVRAPRLEHSRAPLTAARALPARPAARRGMDRRFTPAPPLLPAHRKAAFAVRRPAGARFTAGRPQASAINAARRPAREMRGETAIRFSRMAARIARSLERCRLSGGDTRPPAAGARERLRTAPRRGSGGMAFTAGPPALRHCRPPLGAVMLQVSAQPRTVLAPAPISAPASRSICAGGWTLPAPAPPGRSAPRGAAGPSMADAMVVRAAGRSGMNAMRPRGASVAVHSHDAPPLCPPHNPPPFAAPGGLHAPAHRRAAFTAVRSGAHPRSVLIPAAPHEPMLTGTPLTIRGSFMGTMEDAGTRVRLEEDFAAGLTRWVGKTESWRLDAAGVRTGTLALFGPSLGMRDFQMEFLAKVESGGIGWVFRAPDLDNYFHVRMVMAGSGGKAAWHLSRRAVIAGKAEAPVTVPIDINLRSRASFRLCMTAGGSEFSVAVEGKDVAHWSDARLSEGAIGFLADPGDRTRLYWVKVASPAFGATNDE